MTPKYKRILLKLSGEALAGESGFGLDEKIIAGVVDQLVRAHEMGVEIGIVLGGGNFWRGVKDGGGKMERTRAIILSMTPKERSNPGILNLSRKQRIAKGAGVPISEVNRIVKQFDQMKKMMKQLPGLMGGGGRRKGFGGLGGLMGGKLKMPF